MNPASSRRERGRAPSRRTSRRREPRGSAMVLASPPPGSGLGGGGARTPSSPGRREARSSGSSPQACVTGGLPLILAELDTMGKRQASACRILYSLLGTKRTLQVDLQLDSQKVRSFKILGIELTFKG